MYPKRIRKILKDKGISPGDKVKVRWGDRTYEGILLEGREDSEALVLKLSNGYNIGLITDEIELVSKATPSKRGKSRQPKDFDVWILSFGGTISSRIEYKTGAVFPALNAEDLHRAFPEMDKIAKVRTKEVFNLLSEDMHPEHWKVMAEEVYKALKDDKPVVLTHGTDTMAYSAAALSFMVRNPPRPIVLTGAQRSSDRGSSDNRQNLMDSLLYARQGKPGVFVCMHGSMSDDYNLVHLGVKVRKMHTSRRDAFVSVNRRPVARVDYRRGTLEYIDPPPETGGSLTLDTKMNTNAAMQYIYPGIRPEALSSLSDYDGVVLIGTGLGHVPTNPFGDALARPILTEVRELVESGVAVVMASQTIFGRINLNVYTAGRLLREVGVIGHLCDWTPETAYVKLMWVLGHEKRLDKVKDMMEKNLVGEITERTLPDEPYVG